ncbi:hypothetical protein SODALDRAFT_113994 [Sodiomyces alkalinus F11]|uniref:Transmembrane protein n=1 Tax=Sodiomyces alkalinus (strain CBS 110278 / VKM F-3762 / F11) TaxID=1314773 RepID=A0A3N2Q3I8_SODAK|nr:hypothetical protein SODALDRAFT_113994 [Sodiomyces alkalinus F11]ROT41195.1 hypothetical protein SODALDRAFT_113994 [Sodiomyces alkalinus F11]
MIPYLFIAPFSALADIPFFFFHHPWLDVTDGPVSETLVASEVSLKGTHGLLLFCFVLLFFFLCFSVHVLVSLPRQSALRFFSFFFFFFFFFFWFFRVVFLDGGLLVLFRLGYGSICDVQGTGEERPRERRTGGILPLVWVDEGFGFGVLSNKSPALSGVEGENQGRAGGREGETLRKWRGREEGI